MARKKRKRLLWGWRHGFWVQYEDPPPDDPTEDRTEYDASKPVGRTCPKCGKETLVEIPHYAEGAMLCEPCQNLLWMEQLPKLNG